MKKILIAIIAVGFLYSCGGGNTPKDKESEEKASVNEFSDIAKNVSGDGHNAKNSLDYQGSYTGAVPVNVEGEKKIVSITLENETYLVNFETEKKLILEMKGKYTWNDKGNTIILEDINPKLQFFVGENSLTLLDADGQKIAGESPDQYILRK